MKPAASSQGQLAEWNHHLQDEIDAAFLYRHLARTEKNGERKAMYLRFADVEDRHVEKWRELLTDAGHSATVDRIPSTRARFMAWLGTRIGFDWIAPILLAEEAREVKNYLRLARDLKEPKGRDIAGVIARESAEHSSDLARMLDKPGEPWHAVSSGEMLRTIVYGFNDGLTANFGLIAGMLGARSDLKTVVLTGVSGMLADALSMGASGYLAAKSQAEVYEHEIELEREEIRLMPELEVEELALVYQAKGIDRERAEALARELLAKPELMLQEQVREELDISGTTMLPLKDGLVTGTATAVGAVLPLLPFLLLPYEIAFGVSFAGSMLAHFGVGAARSFFTGRGVWRSGMDMFVVGFGVAAVGYFIGYGIESLLPSK